MMGGCSAHNAMVYLRGNCHDYQEWEKLGAKGWGYKDVLPFFLKSERNLSPELARDREYHSTTGPLNVSFAPYRDKHLSTVLDALRETGLKHVDPNRGCDVGYFLAQQTMGGDGQRSSTNRAYIAPIRKRPNLRVVTNALVTKININNGTKRAESVLYLNHKGERVTAVATKEIVLCAGAYGSPHLLMLSGVGPARHLREAGIGTVADLAGVGQHLTDHFTSSLSVFLLNVSFVPSRERIREDALDYARGRGPWTAMGPLAATVLRRSPLQPASDLRPHLKMNLWPSWSNATARTPREYCFPVNQALCYYNQMSVVTQVLHPESAGYLRLNTSSPQSQPLVYQNVFSDQRDVRKQAEGVRWLWEKLSRSTVLRRAGVRVSLPRQPLCERSGIAKYSQEYFECAVRSGRVRTDGHGSGTCKMGADSDSLAVLDPELRVRTVKGLRVADASVFPAITSGNINAPTIMVGEKAAAIIKRTWEAHHATAGPRRV